MKKQKREYHQFTNQIESLQYGAYSFLHLKKSTKKEMKFLQDEFAIELSDIGDTTSYLNRPKITARDNYLFVVLQFPAEDPTTDTFSAEKVSLFIFPDMVILLHANELSPLKSIKEDLDEYIQKHTAAKFAPGYLVPFLLLKMYDYAGAVSNSVANDIDKLELDIFHKHHGNKGIVKNLFDIERKIVDFRKMTRAHEYIIQKLNSLLPALSKGGMHSATLTDLNEAPQVLWTSLESHLEAIDTLRQTHESLNSFFLNDILKNLTIFSIIIAPMTLIASIFGMNFKLIPYAAHPWGFIGTIGFMILISIAAFFYFKRKGWI